MANLRIDNEHRATQRAAWLATPPAIIQRPLRFCVANDYYIVTDAKGRQARELGPQALAAVHAASYGNGREVKHIARQLLVAA